MGLKNCKFYGRSKINELKSINCVLSKKKVPPNTPQSSDFSKTLIRGLHFQALVYGKERNSNIYYLQDSDTYVVFFMLIDNAELKDYYKHFAKNVIFFDLNSINTELIYYENCQIQPHLLFQIFMAIVCFDELKKQNVLPSFARMQNLLECLVHANQLESLLFCLVQRAENLRTIISIFNHFVTFACSSHNAYSEKKDNEAVYFYICNLFHVNVNDIEKYRNEKTKSFLDIGSSIRVVLENQWKEDFSMLRKKCKIAKQKLIEMQKNYSFQYTFDKETTQQNIEQLPFIDTFTIDKGLIGISADFNNGNYIPVVTLATADGHNEIFDVSFGTRPTETSDLYVDTQEIDDISTQKSDVPVDTQEIDDISTQTFDVPVDTQEIDDISTQTFDVSVDTQEIDDICTQTFDVSVDTQKIDDISTQTFDVSVDTKAINNGFIGTVDLKIFNQHEQIQTNSSSNSPIETKDINGSHHALFETQDNNNEMNDTISSSNNSFFNLLSDQSTIETSFFNENKSEKNFDLQGTTVEISSKLQEAVVLMEDKGQKYCLVIDGQKNDSQPKTQFFVAYRSKKNTSRICEEVRYCDIENIAQKSLQEIITKELTSDLLGCSKQPRIIACLCDLDVTKQFLFDGFAEKCAIKLELKDMISVDHVRGKILEKMTASNRSLLQNANLNICIRHYCAFPKVQHSMICHYVLWNTFGLEIHNISLFGNRFIQNKADIQYACLNVTCNQSEKTFVFYQLKTKDIVDLVKTYKKCYCQDEFGAFWKQLTIRSSFFKGYRASSKRFVTDITKQEISFFEKKHGAYHCSLEFTVPTLDFNAVTPKLQLPFGCDFFQTFFLEQKQLSNYIHEITCSHNGVQKNTCYPDIDPQLTEHLLKQKTHGSSCISKCPFNSLPCCFVDSNAQHYGQNSTIHFENLSNEFKRYFFKDCLFVKETCLTFFNNRLPIGFDELMQIIMMPTFLSNKLPIQLEVQKQFLPLVLLCLSLRSVILQKYCKIQSPCWFTGNKLPNCYDEKQVTEIIASEKKFIRTTMDYNDTDTKSFISSFPICFAYYKHKMYDLVELALTGPYCLQNSTVPDITIQIRK